VIELVVFDVNETLFPLDPVARRLAEVGLGGQLDLWFARVLRDGIAAAAAGHLATFRDLAGHHLSELLRAAGTDEPEAAALAIDHVLAGLQEVEAHPDVEAGLLALRAGGVPAIALTNGSADLTTAFLGRAGLRHLIDEVHDVTSVGRWKPAPDAYQAVLARREVPAQRAAMVAVHPWDLLGSQSVGMVGAWLDRDGAGYPPSFGAPDLRAPTLEELIAGLLALPDRL
jgi:2-haloacid dehalogenase